MSLEAPNRILQLAPGAHVRESSEDLRPVLVPHQTPLSPVAQSIERKPSQLSPAETNAQQVLPYEPELPQEQERPSINRNRHSWRSGRPPSWSHDERDDRRNYRNLNSYDYGGPAAGKYAQQKDYGDPYYDPRFNNYYEHPYYNNPYQGLPPGPPPRNLPSRPNLRNNALVARPASRSSRAPLKPKKRSDEPSEDDSEAERPSTPPRIKKQRQSRAPIWGYDDGNGTPPPPQEVIMRLPFSDWMNSGIKDHFVATIAEFVGTVMFLFFAFAGTQVANINSQSTADTSAAASTTNGTTGFSPIVLTYIALSFGFSLMVNVWIFYRISGGLFNPAVTLGMVMVKAVSYTRGILLVGAQIIGSIVTSLVVKALFPTDFNVRTTLSPGTSVLQGFFIEALLTAELVFAIFMLAKEKHRATHLAPIGIGIAMFVAELVGVFYTGGSLNPARSFGPCVVTGIWDKEHWIYWVAPAAGAIGAVGFYNFIKVLEYEMANPGQDSTSEDKAEAETKAVKEKKEEDNANMA